jgi:hypothetical protein
MGAAMKAVQAKVQEAGLRADGRVLSELVRQKLAGNSGEPGAGSQ